MTDPINHQWVLAQRPDGMVTSTDFERRESPVPAPDDGEFLVRNLYLSLDPAMRAWISERGTGYMPPVQIGALMPGGCVARVEQSRHPGFAEGDLVLGMFGWQEYAVSDGGGAVAVMPVPDGVGPTLPLSALGLTSLTAYFGLKEVGRPQPGETVVVSAAAGATGSVVGQLARIAGCRAVGIAGGTEKCAWLTRELGFDAAIDYKSEDVRAQLREHCPDGIDIYWDNVGGEILDLALAQLATHARVVLCGAISVYNRATPAPGPANYLNLLGRRARMEGFLVFDYMDRVGEAMGELVPLVQQGKLRYREDIRDGLDSAPVALRDLFTGANDGKLLVRIADDTPPANGSVGA
jgi:NADPH-dependent curcumin reductase CurA